VLTPGESITTDSRQQAVRRRRRRRRTSAADDAFCRPSAPALSADAELPTDASQRSPPSQQPHTASGNAARHTENLVKANLYFAYYQMN